MIIRVTSSNSSYSEMFMLGKFFLRSLSLGWLDSAQPEGKKSQMLPGSSF